MSHHPWKQIISDYHVSGLSKCKFIDQYNQAHPEAKISRPSFYRKIGRFEQALHDEEAALSMLQSLPSEETKPEHSSSKEDSVNIIEFKPEALEEAQKLSALPSPANSSKFDTVVIRAPGGVSVTLSTENGVAALSVLLNNLVRSLK